MGKNDQTVDVQVDRPAFDIITVQTKLASPPRPDAIYLL